MNEEMVKENKNKLIQITPECLDLIKNIGLRLNQRPEIHSATCLIKGTKCFVIGSCTFNNSLEILYVSFSVVYPFIIIGNDSTAWFIVINNKIYETVRGFCPGYGYVVGRLFSALIEETSERILKACPEFDLMLALQDMMITVI